MVGGAFLQVVRLRRRTEALCGVQRKLTERQIVPKGRPPSDRRGRSALNLTRFLPLEKVEPCAERSYRFSYRCLGKVCRSFSLAAYRRELTVFSLVSFPDAASFRRAPLVRPICCQLRALLFVFVQEFLSEVLASVSNSDPPHGPDRRQRRGEPRPREETKLLAHQ